MGSIPNAAIDHLQGYCVLAGLNLDGFNGSPPPIVGFPLSHSCPHPIECMLSVMDIHCNSTLGVTSLHCLPHPTLPSFSVLFVFPTQVFLQSLHGTSFTNPLLFSSGMHVFTFIRVCHSVFTGLKAVLINAKCIADLLKLLSQTMDVRGAAFGYRSRRIGLLKYIGHCGSSSQ